MIYCSIVDCVNNDRNGNCTTNAEVFLYSLAGFDEMDEGNYCMYGVTFSCNQFVPTPECIAADRKQKEEYSAYRKKILSGGKQ